MGNKEKYVSQKKGAAKACVNSVMVLSQAYRG
jgi:hypothetical protein